MFWSPNQGQFHFCIEMDSSNVELWHSAQLTVTNMILYSILLISCWLFQQAHQIINIPAEYEKLMNILSIWKLCIYS